MKIELEHLFKESLAKGINLFVGSGFSVLAQDSRKINLPVSESLKTELLKEFSCPNLSSLSLDKVATVLKAKHLDGFNAYVKSRFTVESFDGLYLALNKVRYATIFTTNVDNLLLKLFADNDNFYLNNITKTGPVFAEKAGINYIPLHGCVEDELSNFIFATTEIASAFSSDRDKWHYLTQAFQSAPTIFWGYSLADAGILEALYPQTINKRERKTAWIVLQNSDTAGIEYFRALGLNVIISNTKELLQYIASLEDLREPAAKLTFSTKSIFPEYAIPSPTQVPSRPLVKFYTGEPPIWSDVFSARIHKTKYYFQAENEISGGHNLIVTGIPASGKTTLMMQLAAGVNFNGHKLVCQNLTKEKATFIVRILKGENALIFLDNFVNDISVFNYLYQQKNIRLVGFERDYNYEIVSHKVDKKCRRIDITSLDDRDIQEIFNKIPVEVRTGELFKSKEDEMTPSLFELIQMNTTLPRLKERFAEVIRNLDASKPVLVDILVMFAYVYSCRTFVSFEMLMSFLRNTTGDYREIYQLLQELGLMISDCGASMVETNDTQDYFMPRSTLISEVIMEQAPSRIVKRVITTFHNEVSPYRVFRYDVFKMKAYDSGLMAHAFPEWEEGYKFYDEAYSVDHSAYLRQQGALYLAKMRHYQEAFRWIDEALIQSKHKVFSIRNSHAVILFKANIDKEANDPVVKETLDHSMKILSECYHVDQRKLYHALVFADQAVKYYAKFPDETARGYLQTARAWLVEEDKKGYRKSSILRLLKSVDRTLSVAS